MQNLDGPDGVRVCKYLGKYGESGIRVRHIDPTDMYVCKTPFNALVALVAEQLIPAAVSQHGAGFVQSKCAAFQAGGPIRPIFETALSIPVHAQMFN